jgi:hypothetical protein
MTILLATSSQQPCRRSPSSFLRNQQMKKEKEGIEIAVYFLYFLLMMKNRIIVPITGINSVENSGIGYLGSDSGDLHPL